jgi:hypothetical protein
VGAVVASLALGQLLAGPASALTPQTISFDLPEAEVVGSSIDLAATATSGLTVTFASDTPSICTVTGVVLALIAEGTCTVTASQAGDATWEPAQDVQDSMTVGPTPPPPPDPSPQTISFALPSSGYVGATMPLTGTATSGLDVAYIVETPAICATDGTTLALDAVGTCTVTASQPGDGEWLPAEDVTVSTTVKLSPLITGDGANLGRYALNGPIQSAVVDPETGFTYVGGTFSEIGIRTGSVALVNPPDSGVDTLRPQSPDVIGSELAAFADDTTGYFVTGHIGSVNGDGVRRDNVTRMTTTGTVDTSWSLRTTCGSTQLPGWAQHSVRWDLGDRLVTDLGMSATTSGESTIGLGFIDKETGVAKRTGAGNATCGTGSRTWAGTPVFAPLASCAGWAVCFGHVVDLVKDPGSNSLITAVRILRGQSIATQEPQQTWLIAYDFSTGARRWAIRLDSANPPAGFPSTAEWAAQVTHLAGLGGGILVNGRFPLEPVNRPSDEFTNTILVDAATGTILQRWNRLGEQDLADPLGDEIVPATACTSVNDAVSSYERWRFVARSTTHSIGYGRSTTVGGVTSFAVCDYSVSGAGVAARLVATALGTLPLTESPGLTQPLPSALYAGHILVGPFDAFNLDTGGTFPDWHPSPSSDSVTTVMAGSTVVIVGDSTFVRGERASRVAAFDRDLAPVDGFASALVERPEDWFRSMALDGDHLIFVGRFNSPDGSSHIVALDKETGAIDWMAPSTPMTFAWGLAVDPSTGAFYVGFDNATGSAIKRFVPAGSGYAEDPAFAPILTRLSGTGPSVTALAWIDGRLYVGGQFGSIDGQARQGLARFGVDGTLDSWAPKLVSEMHATPGSTIELVPISFLELGGKVVVSGRFTYLTPIPGGGGSYTFNLPGVRVYSATSGALIRPLDGASWFGTTDGEYAYGSATIAGVVYVALGYNGIAAFDATTFDYLPYLSMRTQVSAGATAIYAVAARPEGSSSAAARSSTAVSTPTMVIGGIVPTWKGRTASNVIEVGPAALNSDHAAPSVSSVTNRGRHTGFTGTAVPWTVAWSGKDTGGSGIARYELAQSRNGSAYTMVDVDVRSVSTGVSVLPGSTYRFRVRAVDRAGNVGGWRYGSTFKVTAVQQTSSYVRYGGRWVTSTSASTWWGGTARASSTKGSTASLTFTGRTIAWVGLKAPTRGKAYLYINGVLKATVDLRATTTLKRRVVWTTTYTTSARRTIMVKVVGTSGRPRIDVDGFLIGS